MALKNRKIKLFNTIRNIGSGTGTRSNPYSKIYGLGSRSSSGSRDRAFSCCGTRTTDNIISRTMNIMTKAK